eukprot:403369365
MVNQTSSQDFDSLGFFIFDVILLFFVIVLYSGCIFFLLVRRQYQPLKNRGSFLIVISVTGNFAYVGCCLVNKLIANAYKVGSFYDSLDNFAENIFQPNGVNSQAALPPSAALEFSCTLSHIQYGMFLPIFMFPYFLRCFRLLQVFRAHNKHFVLKKKKGVFAFKRVKSLYCVRESNLIKWLLIIVIPFFVFTLVAILDKQFRHYFPSFEVLECLSTDESDSAELHRIYRRHLYMTMETYLIVNFIQDMGLILCIYTLRHVQDEFSINFELKFISFIWIIFGFFQFMIMIFFPDSPIITTNSLNYFMVVRGLLSLLVTAVIPIKKSYNPNSIIPFPINEECIKSLEMALLMPTSANYFYDYLENSCENKDALIYFGLYADIRTFLRLIEDGESDFVLRSQAEQIFQDYIGEDKQWDIEIPDEIHIELSSG